MLSLSPIFELKEKLVGKIGRFLAKVFCNSCHCSLSRVFTSVIVRCCTDQGRQSREGWGAAAPTFLLVYKSYDRKPILSKIGYTLMFKKGIFLQSKGGIYKNFKELRPLPPLPRPLYFFHISKIDYNYSC